MRLIYLLFFCFSGVLSCFSANKIVYLSLDGKEYENIHILAKRLYGEKIKINGISTQTNQWIFDIPDSVAEEACFYEVRYNQEGDKREIFRMLGFYGIINGDTLTNYYINFDNNKDTIILHGNFIRTDARESLTSFENDSSGIGYWHTDFFIVNPLENKYLAERMQSPFYSFFMSQKNNDNKYENYLNEYISNVKENPDSKYYITNLAMTLRYYKSKDDVKKIYDNFSFDNKQSYFGITINKYLNHFQIKNVALRKWDSNDLNYIVSDSSKYTLLIFSASWCAPCLKKIPILKDIYLNSNTIMDMVYISLDEQKTIRNWKELMIKEKIPWQSLLLEDNLVLKKDWNIQAIPDYILINPDWEAQKISLNDENDINNLYSIIQND
jgi:thiol-disulfide isomerase/thioredoxin